MAKSSSWLQRCKQMYMTRALQAAAFFTPGLLLPSLETSFCGLVLTILHPQFSCLETTGTICLAFLIIQSTKMIFPLTASLPAGGRSSLFNHTPLRLRESFLSTSSGSGLGPPGQVVSAFSGSSTPKALQGLSQQDCRGRGDHFSCP